VHNIDSQLRVPIFAYIIALPTKNIITGVQHGYNSRATGTTIHTLRYR